MSLLKLVIIAFFLSLNKANHVLQDALKLLINILWHFFLFIAEIRNASFQVSQS